MQKDFVKFIQDNNLMKLDFNDLTPLRGGFKSPIYLDFREGWRNIDLMDSICSLLKLSLLDIAPEVIIGVPLGALPYATLLAYKMHVPLGCVRNDNKPKEYGLKKLIEGADVVNKKVVVLDDVVTTAESILRVANIVKEAGAKEVIPCSLFTYSFDKTRTLFQQSDLYLKSLGSLNDFIDYFKKNLNHSDYVKMLNFMDYPEDWVERSQK